MCTHTFLDAKAKQAFEDASKNMTDREIFEMMKGERAEMLGHWRGEDDFFFCHWEAEEEQDIHDALELNGLDQFCVTACYRIHSHVDTNALTGQIRSYPPWKD